MTSPPPLKSVGEIVIRSAKRLREVLAEGHAVIVQGLWAGAGRQLVVEETGEPVSPAALSREIAAGAAHIASTDLVGEPARWVAA